MSEVTLMLRSKETDNKQRWAADVNGVEFKLYIPKYRIPDPFPPSIVVRISPATGAEPPSAPDPDQPIRCVVARGRRLWVVNTRRRYATARWVTPRTSKLASPKSP